MPVDYICQTKNKVLYKKKTMAWWMPSKDFSKDSETEKYMSFILDNEETGKNENVEMKIQVSDQLPIRYLRRFEDNRDNLEEFFAETYIRNETQGRMQILSSRPHFKKSSLK